MIFNSKFLSLLLCSIVIFLPYPGSAQKTSEKKHLPDPITVDEKFKFMVIGKYAEYLEDKDRKWNIDNIKLPEFADKFKKVNVAVPNFGFSESAYWLRFRIKASEIKETFWKLEVGFPLLDYVTLYAPDKEGNYSEYKTGYLFPFAQRGNWYRNFVFTLPLFPGQDLIYYLRVENGDRLEIPISIWNTNLYQKNNETEMFVLGMYYCLIFVIMLLNVILLFAVRDKTYLYYVIFIASYGMYQFTQNGLTAKYLMPENTATYNHFIHILASILVFFGSQFSRSFLNTKKNAPLLDKFYLIYQHLYLFNIITPLFMSYPKAISILVYMIIPGFFIPIILGIRVLFRKNRLAIYYLVAWTIMMISALIMVCKNVGLLETSFFTTYSFHIGSTIEMIILTTGLGEKIYIMRKKRDKIRKDLIETQQQMVENLIDSNLEREEANKKIRLSEERYRLIVEGSKDIIISVDENWNFISANESIFDHFRVPDGDITKMNFQDLLYEGSDKSLLSGRIVQEKLDMFTQSNSPVQFKADFKSPISTEAKEMSVTLEHIAAGNRKEFLIKITDEIEDSLLKNIEYEKQVLSIGNYLTTAEDVSFRLTRNLRKFMDHSEINMIRVALIEVLINAIEHGNLEISFNEKTEILAAETYFQFISQRQNDDMYKNRKVTIEYILEMDKVSYKIEDEGKGFDHKTLLKKLSDEVNETMISHGRGISLAMNIFDKVDFNDFGNVVFLTKYFRPI